MLKDYRRPSLRDKLEALSNKDLKEVIKEVKKEKVERKWKLKKSKKDE